MLIPRSALYPQSAGTTQHWDGQTLSGVVPEADPVAPPPEPGREDWGSRPQHSVSSRQRSRGAVRTCPVMRLQPWTEQQGVLERVLHMQALLIGGRDPNLPAI